MRIHNIFGAGALFLGLTVYAAHTPAAAASPSPDTEALNAGYQLILFDIAESNAVGRGVSPVNGSGVVSADILTLSGKISADAREYRTKVESVAKSNDIELQTKLSYTLSARFAALIRNQGPGLGKRYLEDQISSHEDALAVFQDEAENGTIPEIKTMAADVIPLVQANLDSLNATLAKHVGG